MATIETFFALVAEPQTCSGDVFADAGYTRCGSGMGESRDD